MGIINTQAIADARKARTGKDGALYNGRGKLLARVETFQSQMAVSNQKYHPLGTPREQEVLDTIGVTLTFTEWTTASLSATLRQCRTLVFSRIGNSGEC